VSVEHGLVEVADTDMTELVHAGERFVPGQPITREPLASETPPAAPVVAAPTSAALTPAAVPAVAPAAAPAAPAARPASEAVAPSLRAAAPARLHARRLASADAPRGSVDAIETSAPTAGAPAIVEGSPAPAAEVKTAAVPESVAATSETPLGGRARSVQVLFELAAQLEIRDPEAALRIYGELAAAPSPADGGWAASSLFAAARLEAERGHAAQSRELCDSYLRRFPRGPNADDARTLLAHAR
jgi:hypothetical protein